MPSSHRFACGWCYTRAHGLRAGVATAVGSLLLGLASIATATGDAGVAARTQPPGLAQPQFLTPTAEYPRPQFRPPYRPLAQPQFVAPADEVIVSDMPTALDATPQAPATPTKQKSSQANVKPSTGGSGSGWFGQFLGTNSPPPDSSLHAGSPPSGLANPFLMTSGQPPSMPLEQARPTSGASRPAPAQDATESTAPNLLEQLGVTTEPPAHATQASHRPRQPTESVASALWRPLSMTNDAPPITTPASEPGRNIVATDRIDTRPESERVPSLLRPFYATNQPQSGSSRAARAPARDASQSLADALSHTSLGHQLAMLSGEELRTASPDAEMLSEPPTWDGTVTVQWPLMANPFMLTDAAEPSVYRMGEAVQVAFLQESLPSPDGGAEPDEIDLPSDEDTSAPSNGGSAAAADGEKKEDSLVGAEKLGPEPEDNSLEFLRNVSVLLEPGKMQFDIGLEYTLSENDFPILLGDGMGNIVGVDEVLFKGRELAVPMELRYGLLKRVQVFLQVPVGWSNNQVSIDNFDAFDNDGGIGDVGFGATMQLRDAEKDLPYIIGTISAIAPTGGDPFTGVVGIAPSAPSLGNGFWSVAGNLTWIQTRYDPVIVFYGLGTRYQFSHEYIGIDFQPGPEYNYTFGAGFAVNERVTLSTQFFGAYVEELKANGDRIEGSNQEPMNIRLAATFVNPCKRIVEPFVVFGLTDDAVSANIGVTWTY